MKGILEDICGKPRRCSLPIHSQPEHWSVGGYKVILGVTIEKNFVMFAPSSYFTIPNAIRNGLPTATSLATKRKIRRLENWAETDVRRKVGEGATVIARGSGGRLIYLLGFKRKVSPCLRSA